MGGGAPPRLGRMGKWIAFALAVVMFGAGGVWSMQSLGVWEGGNPFTHSIGPIVAGLGVALAFVSLRGLPK